MREKMFGAGRGLPLDRNAKVRVMAYAQAWNARHKRPGQHHGPLTRTFMDVLEALLWGFHNSRDGRCFPSYEAIAKRAGCCRDTVCEAIKALELADVLTWANRITRARLAAGWRVIRTSNAYAFRDPLPCAGAKSENPPGTNNPDSILRKPLVDELATALSRLQKGLFEKKGPTQGILGRPRQRGGHIEGGGQPPTMMMHA